MINDPATKIGRPRQVYQGSPGAQLRPNRITLNPAFAYFHSGGGFDEQRGCNSTNMVR